MKRDNPRYAVNRFHTEDKGQCQMWHFKKRLRERLGIKITDDEYYKIISVLKNNEQHELYQFKYVTKQSNRLRVYQLTIKGHEPVNVVYDNIRKTIITVMFQTDGKEYTYYYDVFNNKINIKEKFGLGFAWTYADDQLVIPHAKVIKNGDVFECVEGYARGMRFKFDNGALIEVI